MRANYTLPRLYVDASLIPLAEIQLDKPQNNHLLNVLRLGEGANVLIFNGRDGEWLATLNLQSKRKAVLCAQEQTRVQPPAGQLIYCFAPLKSARLDYMVQKAVEMGASSLQPVITQHCQLSKPNMERMATYVREAAQQCGILNIPTLQPPQKLEAMLSKWPHNRPLIFCDESVAGDNPLPTLQNLATTCGANPMALLVGPEGGFSEHERNTLHALPFVSPIALGPNILRADTAAVAALALIQATCFWSNENGG